MDPKQQQQQPGSRAHVRGVLRISDASVKAQFKKVAEGIEMLECMASLVDESSGVEEQAHSMKRLVSLCAHDKLQPAGDENREKLLQIVFRLLFDELIDERPDAGTPTHLYVPLAKIMEQFYPRHTRLIDDRLKKWASERSAERGVRGWMQLAALLAGPHEQLTNVVCTQLRQMLIPFFIERAHVLSGEMSGSDDHVGRLSGREAEALLSCLRDLCPRLMRLGFLDDQDRANLAKECRACLFACRWTQIHCGVGGMAVAVLHVGDVVADLTNSSFDLGARLCLSRGVCNSTPEKETIIINHVWPFVRDLLERSDLGSMSTTNRHFLLSALDAVARCPALETSKLPNILDVVRGVCAQVIVNFETTVHAPLDPAMKSILKLFTTHGKDEDIRELFASIWGDGRAPLLGPLDHFVQSFGEKSLQFFPSNFVKMLVDACGDVRMKPGAMRVFGSFVAAGGQGWESELRNAMQSKNKTLHLSVAQHLIPIVFKVLTVEVAVQRLISSAQKDDSMLRLAMASHLSNQKREFQSLVISDVALVERSLVAYNPWLRRYGLETAVSMQDARLVGIYMASLAKEHSQSQRSTASGALCRWFKTKVGARSNVGDWEDKLSWSLYSGSPSARQGTVSAWLAAKKTVVSPAGSEIQTMLLEMLCSRYDANRNIAAYILRDFYAGKGPLADPAERALLLKLCSASLRCIRIRIADGGARLFGLLYTGKEAISEALQMLQMHLSHGRTDFLKLASQYTLHGPLLVLRYLLQERPELFESADVHSLLDCCIESIGMCKPFVCDNKLEGMSENVKLAVPFQNEDSEDEEDEEEDDEFSAGSHVRVCAWRGVRESCLVIGSAMQRLLHLMTDEDISRTADALLSIVLNSKHRGALENASIGLEQTCAACLKSLKPARLLPQVWLERVLNFDAKAMGTVRRSAGIPYAICVILKSEWAACSKRDANTPLVSITMKKLLHGLDQVLDDQGNDGDRDVSYYRTHVHYLNILRHVLRDASLADSLRPFLESLLLLSLRMWNHKEWSIRNSASLLFASAMRKLDPDTSHDLEEASFLKLKKFEFRLFRSHFAELIKYIGQVLAAHAANISTCSEIFSDLFPILLILKKLHVAIPDDVSEGLRHSCVILSAHRNQMIRHGAAKAVAALTDPPRCASECAQFIAGALDAYETSSNKTYGLLFCALELGLSNKGAYVTDVPLTTQDVLCIPVLLSLRCPPVASLMARVATVWKLKLSANVADQVRADVDAHKRSMTSVVPVFQTAVEALEELLSGRDAKAPVAVASHAGTSQTPLACEEDSEPPLRAMDRNKKEDLLELAHLLDGDARVKRKQACIEFARLFPEVAGNEPLHPVRSLSLLFKIIAKHAEWSCDWFFSLLTDRMHTMASQPLGALLEDLTMKTVFEKEDNALFSEPVLMMQLAVRELMAMPSNVLQAVVEKRATKFFHDWKMVLKEVSPAAARTSHWDMHFWVDLFVPFFGAICAWRVVAGKVKDEELDTLLHSIDLPHLLRRGRDNGNLLWLLHDQ